MKEIEIKCPRCGKVKTMNYKEAKQTVECPHCHFGFQLDKKTLSRQKWMTLLSTFLIILVISFVLTFTLRNANNMVLILILVLLGLVVAYVSNPIGAWLTFQFWGFSYEPKPKK